VFPEDWARTQNSTIETKRPSGRVEEGRISGPS
jgi:hypothetical protein